MVRNLEVTPVKDLLGAGGAALEDGGQVAGEAAVLGRGGLAGRVNGAVAELAHADGAAEGDGGVAHGALHGGAALHLRGPQVRLLLEPVGRVDIYYR